MRVIKVISLLKKNLTKSSSIREISQRAGISYDGCYKTILNLSGRGIILLRRKGRINYCSLGNSKEAKLVLSEASLLETEDFLKEKVILKKVVSELLEKIKKEIYSLVLFGSYAKEKERKASDIDLFCLAELNKRSKILKEARFLGMKYNKEIQVTVADKESFEEMLKAKEVNVGTEVLDTGKVLYGFEAYWDIILDLMKEK